MPSSLPRSFRSLMSRLVATFLINKLVAMIVGAAGVLCVSHIASHSCHSALYTLNLSLTREGDGEG
jgi:hypothetical protein